MEYIQVTSRDAVEKLSLPSFSLALTNSYFTHQFWPYNVPMPLYHSRIRNAAVKVTI